MVQLIVGIIAGAVVTLLVERWRHRAATEDARRASENAAALALASHGALVYRLAVISRPISMEFVDALDGLQDRADAVNAVASPRVLAQATRYVAAVLVVATRKMLGDPISDSEHDAVSDTRHDLVASLRDDVTLD